MTTKMDPEEQRPLTDDVEAAVADAEAEPAEETKAPAAPSKPSLHPAYYVASWIFFSNATILFNKWLLDDAGFRYPVILTCWHLVFSTIATQLLARYTPLLDSRHRVRMTGRLYLRAIVPIGVLFSAALVCSNLAYLYISVAFISMLKTPLPVAVLFTSWFMGVSNPKVKVLINVLVIVTGTTMASVGEIHFSWMGFALQMGSLMFEAVRLVMVQVLLSGDDQKMDPLVSLYYFAPVCAAMNVVVVLCTEWSTFSWADVERVGYLILLLNALVAFMLNVSSVFLIGKTSGLFMTLTSIFKNIMLVALSVFLFNTSLTLLQVVGYGIALVGLVYYTMGWDSMTSTFTQFKDWLRKVRNGEVDEKGEVVSLKGWARKTLSLSHLDETRLTPRVRMTIFIVIWAAIVLMLLVGFLWGGASETADPMVAYPKATLIDGYEPYSKEWLDLMDKGT